MFVNAQYRNMTRINLQIDSTFASILKILKLEYPLLADPDLIKVAVGDFYNRVQLKKQKEQIDSLPTLQLTPEQTTKLENNLIESVNSGFEGVLSAEEFLANLKS